MKGDSGGPLHVVDPLSGRHYQVGVMIASNGCGMKDFPSISTKVAPYLPWMRNLVRGLWNGQQNRPLTLFGPAALTPTGTA